MNESALFAVRNSDGKVTSRKVHLFLDCKAIDGDGMELSSREVELLGLSVCAICDKRKKGGPAIDALEGFFGEDWPYPDEQIDDGPRGAAWRLVEYLKERGMYVSSRKKKDA